MPNPSSTSSSKTERARRALLLAATLIVLLETAFAFLPENKLVITFRADSIPAQGPDWQIMGDSVAKGGILPAQVMAALPPGTLVHNAAVAGTGPEFAYFILQRQIALGKAPKAILYAPSPHTFSSERVALLVGGYARWGEIATIASLGNEIPEVAYGVLCKFSYTLRYREQLGGLIKGHRLDAEEQGNAPTGEQRARHYTVATIHPMYKKPFKVADFNRALLEKFLGLATENHIPVYWFTMPVMPAVEEGRAPHHFNDDYTAFLADLKQRHSVQILQSDFQVWDETNFHDMTHLNSTGAIRLSKLLGEKLAKPPSPPQDSPL